MWLTQLMFNYGIASHACFPDGKPYAQVIIGWQWARSATIVINAIAIVVCLTGVAISLREWRISSIQDSSSIDEVMEKGEGPQKYLELWGHLVGLGFLAAVLFNTVTLLTVPMCQG
ncbi:MAG: hypothetical protein IVW54_05090 [Candidatus Binataceae bacterium]|nr:hypothetical protein [Candidatus Binataceae bacterium]